MNVFLALVLSVQVVVNQLRYDNLSATSLGFFINNYFFKEFLQKLNLNSSERVLDVGCGIGGGDFLMAEVSFGPFTSHNKKKINYTSKPNDIEIWS
jgi:hypothetical protein